MWWLLLGILGLSSCTGVPDAADPRVLSGRLSIDSAFSDSQKQQVVAAVEMWTRATGGLFQPQLVVEEVQCGQAFAIEAVAEQGCRVGHAAVDEPEDSGLRVLGEANRRQHTVTVVSWLQGDSFRYNVAHELGHYLLMGHGEGIMAQQRHGQTPVVTNDSLREFCSVWACSSNSL